MYHRHDEKGLNWEPGGIRSGAGVRSSGVSQESAGSSDTWEAAVLETVAVAVHLQDVNVVGEPVKQSAGEPLGAEHVGPLVEGQVGGDQDGAPLVALGEDLEGQLGRGAGQGDKTQFVYDQQVQAALCRLCLRR